MHLEPTVSAEGEFSFCAHTILDSDRLLEIPDVAQAP